MGVDISHIIRNDFHDIEDHEKAIAYVRSTMKLLSARLHILYENDDDWELRDDYDESDSRIKDYEISFRLPVYDVEFFLHNGFWQIESYFHYCQIVMHHGAHFPLRERIFDLSYALDQREAWHAEEFFTWNGLIDAPGSNLEEWLILAASKYGREIPKFEQDLFLSQDDNKVLEYEPIYYDDFKDCFAELERMKNLVADRGKVLGIQKISKFIRCEVGGGINLFCEETNSFVFDKPVEDILCSLNGPEFLVKCGEKKALFDSRGCRLSDFVDGSWQWEWSKLSLRGRTISNVSAHLYYEVP